MPHFNIHLLGAGNGCHRRTKSVEIVVPEPMQRLLQRIWRENEFVAGFRMCGPVCIEEEQFAENLETLALLRTGVLVVEGCHRAAMDS